MKPANIEVRPDGTVKVLDFGLAKALGPPEGDGFSRRQAEAEASALQITSPAMTQAGLILGTAAYMAPEQAKGKAVDKRADIWAFGVVLYEVLSGQRAFKSEDISVTLASVIKDEVNWQALPADLPEPIRRLSRRCLEKDPKRRLRDIGEARLTLENPASIVSEAEAKASALQSAGGAVEAFVQPFPPTGAKYQVSNGGGRAPVWSPDGKQLFFHNLGPNRIFVVDVNAGRGLTFGTPVPMPIDGTVHPALQRNYDVTPDGKQLIVVLPAQATQSDNSRPVSGQINVVLNWFEELKTRAPQKP